MSTEPEPKSEPLFVLVAAVDGFPIPVGVWDGTVQDCDEDEIDRIKKQVVDHYHVHETNLHVLRIDLPVDTLKKLVYPRIDASKCELTHDDGLS